MSLKSCNAIHSYKYSAPLGLIAIIIMVLYMITNIIWLFYTIAGLIVFFILSGVMMELKASSYGMHIVNGKLVIKRKFRKDYSIDCDRIIRCVVVPIRGMNLEFDVKESQGKKIRLIISFWVASDSLYSQINELSERCEVYVWRWYKFWQGEKKWTPVKVTSTWVPFEERDRNE